MDPDENAFRSPPESPHKKDEEKDVLDRASLRNDVLSKLEEKRQQLRRQRSHSRQKVWRMRSQSRLGSTSSVTDGLEVIF